MQGREAPPRCSGTYTHPTVLFLLFVPRFGLIFYELHRRSVAFAKEKKHHDLLSSPLQSMPLTTPLSTNPTLKVILTTGAIDLNARREFRKLMVSDIMMKSFLFGELTLCVRKVLNAR